MRAGGVEGLVMAVGLETRTRRIAGVGYAGRWRLSVDEDATRPANGRPVGALAVVTRLRQTRPAGR